MDDFKISLKAARVNADLTQDDVCKALNISKQTVVNWEKGKIVPGTMQTDCLCRLYNVPLERIFLPSKST